MKHEFDVDKALKMLNNWRLPTSATITDMELRAILDAGRVYSVWNRIADWFKDLFTIR